MSCSFQDRDGNFIVPGLGKASVIHKQQELEAKLIENALSGSVERTHSIKIASCTNGFFNSYLYILLLPDPLIFDALKYQDNYQ